MDDQQITEFSFQKPAIYKIKVQGDLSTTWSERLGGMQISVERPTDAETISVLIGKMPDQAALSGVLMALYDLHLTIISVSMLKDEG